ncbi:hypothetical protein HQ865_18595 [Mucilaginibacter mali]|uniref:Uncharacterized protein n=1 Tax=Mucilaginibacter mali TaxID=2740462 RepID=A0A7D4PVM7_9SPHI|nr:hypothetical protein [Mucilaginibacter mali]QKJ31688.1 hypothetical protein HQ865_18595 [Mucilaginibacter mali]
MERQIFETQKQALIKLIDEYLTQKHSIEHKAGLYHILGIINQHTYDNRLHLKGTITHTIIDSLQLDYLLGEKLIRFDENIS